jgi:hypothetical protein
MVPVMAHGKHKYEKQRKAEGIYQTKVRPRVLEPDPNPSKRQLLLYNRYAQMWLTAQPTRCSYLLSDARQYALPGSETTGRELAGRSLRWGRIWNSRRERKAHPGIAHHHRTVLYTEYVRCFLTRALSPQLDSLGDGPSSWTTTG